MNSRCWLELSLLQIMIIIVCSSDIAILEVVLYENNAGGFTTYNYKVHGHYVSVGPVTSAEGDILQLHGQNLCSSTKDVERKIYEYGWVGVMRILPPHVLKQPCLKPFQMAEIAMQRGATAVVFDVSDDLDALQELENNSFKLLRPVIVVSGKEANKLNKLLDKQRLARARIQFSMSKHRTQQQRSNEYFDMGIFMAFFVLVSLICLVLLVKIKWRQKRKQTSLTRMALQAISRMETRKYTSPLSSNGSQGSQHSLNTVYSCNRWPTYDIKSCAICLEEFTEGQDIRVVPCRHEFHTSCVDPWLLSNCTCPLCMLNIVEPLSRKKKRRHRSFSGLSARQMLRSLLQRRCNDRDANRRNTTSNADSTQMDVEEAAQGLYTTETEAHEHSEGVGMATNTHGQVTRLRDRDPITLPSINCDSTASTLALNPVHDPLQLGSSTFVQISKNFSQRECLTQHRLHKCKLHQKKLKGTNCSSPLAPSQKEYERSIVVVANLPLDSLETLQEDVV